MGILVDLETMKAAVKDPRTVKLDVRDVDEWIAESSSPYGKDFCPRKGRIRGAVWIEWYRMIAAKLWRIAPIKTERMPSICARAKRISARSSMRCPTLWWSSTKRDHPILQRRGRASVQLEKIRCRRQECQRAQPSPYREEHDRYISRYLTTGEKRNHRHRPRGDRPAQGRITRTHLALQKDAPLHRAVQRSGVIVAIPILAGLHHQYVRI